MPRLTAEICDELDLALTGGYIPAWVPDHLHHDFERLSAGASVIFSVYPMDNYTWRDGNHGELLCHHLFMTAVNMLLLTEEYELAVAGFLHDIGKLFTHKFCEYEGKTVSGYPGHATVGAQMVIENRLWTAAFGLTPTRRIVNLITHHMCGKYCTESCTKSNIASVLNCAYGEDFMDEWFYLAKADDMSRICESHDEDFDFTHTDLPRIPRGHASRVVITLIGHIGVGKSTFAKMLVKHGFKFLSRDMMSVVVLLARGPKMPHPDPDLWATGDLDLIMADPRTMPWASQNIKAMKLGKHVNRMLREEAAKYDRVIVETLVTTVNRQMGAVVPPFSTHIHVVLTTCVADVDLEKLAETKRLPVATIRSNWKEPQAKGFSVLEKAQDGTFPEFLTRPTLVHVVPRDGFDGIEKEVETVLKLCDIPMTGPVAPTPRPTRSTRTDVACYDFVQETIKRFMDSGLSIESALLAIESHGYKTHVKVSGDDIVFSVCYKDPKPLDQDATIDLRNTVFMWVNGKYGEPGKLMVLIQAMPVMTVYSVGSKDLDEWTVPEHGAHRAAVAILMDEEMEEEEFDIMCKEDGMHIRMTVTDWVEFCKDLEDNKYTRFHKKVMEYSMQEYGYQLTICSNGAVCPDDPNVMRFIREGFEATYGEFTPENVVDTLMPFYLETMGESHRATFSYEAISDREFPGLVVTHEEPALLFLGARIFTGDLESQYFPLTALQDVIRKHKVYDALYWRSTADFGKHIVAHMHDGTPMPPSLNWHDRKFEAFEGLVIVVPFGEGNVLVKCKVEEYLWLHHPGAGYVTNANLVATANLPEEIRKRFPLAVKLRQLMDFKDYTGVMVRFREYESKVESGEIERPVSEGKKVKPITNPVSLAMYWFKKTDHPEIPEMLDERTRFKGFAVTLKGGTPDAIPDLKSAFVRKH